MMSQRARRRQWSTALCCCIFFYQLATANARKREKPLSAMLSAHMPQPSFKVPALAASDFWSECVIKPPDMRPYKFMAIDTHDCGREDASKADLGQRCRTSARLNSRKPAHFGLPSSHAPRSVASKARAVSEPPDASCSRAVCCAGVVPLAPLSVYNASAPAPAARSSSAPAPTPTCDELLHRGHRPLHKRLIFVQRLRGGSEGASHPGSRRRARGCIP